MTENQARNMQRKNLFNLLKGIRIFTAAGVSLSAHHTCIWIVTTAVFGILAPRLQ
jgi:hypothetical protein